MTGFRTLAPYATRAEQTRGRLHPEAESATRTAFQRDRDRIIHCTAFRRLEYKTQVFVNHEGDHYRTRLTHSLEVAQITRSICRALGLDDDLGEAVALAHDLGHTPFGHAGEEALDNVMQSYGGFDHNAQTLRILTRLEQRYAEFDGLNLTWETLEGVVKHNGPVRDGQDGGPIPAAIAEYVGEHDLELDTWCGPEAQIASLCDDIAYSNHDIDDGLRAKLFAIEDIADVPMVGGVIDEVRRRYGNLEEHRLINEVVRRLITFMVDDLVGETLQRIAELSPTSADDIRLNGGPVVGFSPDMGKKLTVLRDFLFARMYRHPHVNEMSGNARRVVGDLFAFYMDRPSALPAEWQTRIRSEDEFRRARSIADYIAGMTDRYALEQHRLNCE